MNKLGPLGFEELSTLALTHMRPSNCSIFRRQSSDTKGEAHISTCHATIVSSVVQRWEQLHLVYSNSLAMLERHLQC